MRSPRSVESISFEVCSQSKATDNSPTSYRLLKFTAKNFENDCVIECALQCLRARAAAEGNGNVNGAERGFRVERGRFQLVWGWLLAVIRLQLARYLRCAIRPGAIWTCRPGNPGLSGRIESEQRDAAVFEKWETIQAQSADCRVPANNDCRSLASVASCSGNGVV